MAIIPQFYESFNPILKALKALGGSGSIKEINDKVIESMNLAGSVLEQLHDPESRNETEVEYRLAWARTYLKKYDLINNSSRGIWALTEKAENVPVVDPDEIVEQVRLQSRKQGERVPESKPDEPSLAVDDDVDQGWEAELHRILTKQLEPAAFERLVQRILRESGFVEVHVTGRSGDGGIDGKGIAKIHGIMSFHVIFQCKRYLGVVSAGEVRDFRGAMVGRADKGIFITTGTFSRDAVKEATRDGAPPIDLMDGEQLAAKLKELRLGVKVEKVEKVTVDPDWFQTRANARVSQILVLQGFAI
ncbi:MAG TPA: restriction endonuclease [Isosphaeraceae bacterium]|jgi:restriction system protein|nr:restriction endonuclease [Isosphaeraceae bacterium]